ncbi:hypothetical protein [Ruminiclostridium cellobioparum]|jgi:hypothetical protein|uniref:hypothetical protein n=1 Tax=Ruminiclostridium cellobioparum TaxID=29355 RepID=UPI000489CFCC|nr:hypothetical protein [Ruminiclostridium cellobioparum]
MKIKKILGIGLLVTCLAMSSFSIFAKSPVTGYCGQIKCTGSVSFGTDSASATTSAASSSVLCTASVEYKYGFNQDTYIVSSDNSYPSSSVTAYVNADHYSVRNLGAIGTHGVYAASSSWYDVSSIGSF